MRFLKKASKTKSFGVEDYSSKQKDFFINIGFKETIIKGFKGEVIHKTLSYRGTGSFGFWSKEEVLNITKATKKEFGRFKVRTLTIAELM